MAIQLRRGDYDDFDKTKMQEGELAVVTSSDPNTESGCSAYVSYASGDESKVKRLLQEGEIEKTLEELGIEALPVASSSDVWQGTDALIPMNLLETMLSDPTIMQYLQQATNQEYGVTRLAGGAETALGEPNLAATPYDLKYILTETGHWSDEQMSDESKGIVQNKVIKQYIDEVVSAYVSKNRKIAEVDLKQDISTYQFGQMVTSALTVGGAWMSTLAPWLYGLCGTKTQQDNNTAAIEEVEEKKTTTFHLKGSSTPTTNASEYPGVKVGDICVSENNYKAWICQYASGSAVSWSELLTATGAFIWNNFYSKTATDNKLETKADKTYVDSAIDAVNQFKISIVTELPTENIDARTIYFVPKTDTDIDDNYDEWMYLNGNWEHIGNTVIDLTGYVKNTDLSGINKLGLVQIPYNGGIGVSGSGSISVDRATSPEIEGLTNQYKPIVPSNLRKAVETIGGVVNNLNTDDKTDYVSAINEVLQFATRERTWKKIRTITVPSDEFKGQTIDGVLYGYKNECGIKSVGFNTDEDGSALSQHKITGVQIKLTPTTNININQGFITVGSKGINAQSSYSLEYFTTIKNTTAIKWFECTTTPTHSTAIADNPGQWRLPGKRNNFMNTLAFGGHEETSVLGEGTKIEIWAYGYWD